VWRVHCCVCVRERKIESVFVRVCERKIFVLCQSVAIYVMSMCPLHKCVHERRRKIESLFACEKEIERVGFCESVETCVCVACTLL